jgi:hypothetical protein
MVYLTFFSLCIVVCCCMGGIGLVDTFVGFLRLLIFLYTGTLPDGSDGALLEDLMAADRYVIPEMKLLCENMLVPSESNWLDLLRAAQLLNSLRLELQVMAFLKVNFTVLRGLYDTAPALSEEAVSRKGGRGEGEGAGEGEGKGEENKKKKKKEEEEEEEEEVQYSTIADFQAEFPGLLEDLLESRKILFPLPPSQVMMTQTVQNNAAAEQAKAAEQEPAFPIWALAMAAGSFFMYQHVSKLVALGPLIPAINFVVLVVLLVYGLKMLK